MATRTTSTGASEVLPQNKIRKSFIIQNEDTTDSVYIKFERAPGLTVSATDHDHKIGPGALIAVNSMTDGLAQIQERTTCIASANTPRIAFFETEDRAR